MAGWMLLALLVTPAIPSGDSPGGSVTVPLSDWERMLAELEAAKEAEKPPVAVGSIERTLEGTFAKGLFSGTLVARFEYLADAGHVRVPVLDGAASLGEVLLDGQRTSLLREGDMYTVGVDRRGRHEVRLKLFVGREQDRFARRLHLRLPESGATQFSILIPESDIEARLGHGALVSEKSGGGGTRLVGHIDGSGLLDLSWNRRLRHKADEAVRMEARLNTVVTVQDAMVAGLAVFDLDILEGETDRVDLSIPREIEVVRVEGDAVLQWRTEGSGKLSVLLRYLVSEHTRIAVHYQQPAEPQPVVLGLPLPTEGVSFTGSLGVQAPAGLDVRVSGAEAAEELSARDVPAELGDLSTSPLLLAFRFTQAPKIGLAIARHKEVELTSTLVDELQASTVLIESGTEITKLKLRIRNNTRQYLTMVLPPGAVLTHSLIDGQPVRPAVSPRSTPGRESLLLPLRQSEKLGSGTARTHVVRDGETLSDIANFYYSDPTMWRSILDDNKDTLVNENDLRVGEAIRLPVKRGAVVEESSFVVELAYKRKRPALGLMGRAQLSLPDIDVETVNATWHLYLPGAVTPLAFDSNLTQYSAIRYDPFRRVRDFLERALWLESAWAGGAYKSILSQRKVIWQNEVEKKSGAEIVLSAFPLVGERYRFKRILLGAETPKITVSYSASSLANVVRWGAFVISFGFALLLIGANGGSKRARPIAAGAVVALILMLIVGHYFLGVHRRLLWGVDVALLVTLARARGGPFWAAAREVVWAPWTIFSRITIKNLLILGALAALLGVMVNYPLLLSTIGLAILLVVRWRRARVVEVSHAS